MFTSLVNLFKRFFWLCSAAAVSVIEYTQSSSSHGRVIRNGITTFPLKNYEIELVYEQSVRESMLYITV